MGCIPSKQSVESQSVEQTPSEKRCHSLMAKISKSESFKPRDAANKIIDFETQQVKAMIEYLEKVLRESDGELDKGRLLNLLCRLVAGTDQFPSTYELKNVKVSKAQVAGGDGGFANVYRGKWRALDVCVKIRKPIDHRRPPPAAALEKVNKTFIKECVIWAHFLHPNVLPLFGVILVDGEWAPVSPWMPNGNISDFVLDHPRIPRPPLILDILAGLTYLHSMNVVHGDLKGQNVLVSRDARAVLADFGLSKSTNATAAGFSHLGDSFSGRWSAPEMISVAADDTEPIRPTAAGDVWSLGCLIYEILSTKLPYWQYNLLIQVMHAVGRKEHPRRPDPKQGSEYIDDPTWQLLLKCWNFNPSERPLSQQVQKEYQALHRTIDRGQLESQEMTVAKEIRSSTHAQIDYELIYQLISTLSYQKQL